MKIPFIDLQAVNRPFFAEYQTLVKEVIASCAFTLSPCVEEFEKAFANYLGVPHVISLNSGTDALIIALKCLGIGPGDEVITTPHSFYATLEAILHVGATPVFVDIEAETALIDTQKIPDKISSKTKAILPVHLYGQPADMDPLLDTARKHGLFVVEDACQAHGSLYKNKKTGTFGEFGCFSFYPSKNLGGFGDGGALVTNDAKLAEMAKKFRNHGSLHKVSFDLLGYNSRLDSLQAVILSLKLKSLDQNNAQRTLCANLYRKELASLPWLQPLQIRSDRTSNEHLFVVTLPPERRAHVQEHLQNAGIEARVYYDQPLHKMPVLRHTAQERYPVTETLCQSSLALPMHSAMTVDHVMTVVECLRGIGV